jgi:MFS family permease
MTTARSSSLTDIRRLAAGRLIAVTGGAAAYVALMFTIWERTHSAGLQSLALLLTFGVVGLTSPLTGHLGDRFDRRKIMIAAEIGSAVFYAGMALVAHSPLVLIGFAFGSALCEAPFLSASAAAIPNLAGDPEELARANSLLGIGRNAGIMIGPVIGGLLLHWIGDAGVFALTAVTFTVSAGITFTVRGRTSDTHSEEEIEAHRGVLAGVSFLLHEPVLSRMSLAWFVFLLGMGMSMVADAPLAEYFGAGSLGFGVLIACWGGGSLLGSLLGRRLNARTEYRWLVLGAFGIAAGGIGVGLAPLFAIALTSMLLMGVCDGLTLVAETGIMQRRSHDAVRARVMAAFEAVLAMGMAIAYLAAGPVLQLVGAQAVYLVGGVAALLAALVLLPLLRLGRSVAPESGSGLDVPDLVPPAL